VYRALPVVVTLAGVVAFSFALSGDPCRKQILGWGLVVGALLFGWAASMVAARLSPRTWLPVTAANPPLLSPPGFSAWFCLPSVGFRRARTR